VNIEPTPLIINAALTGMVPTKADNPALPITPEEIAEDAARCVHAGASILHLHARDEKGGPTYRAEVYARIITAIREHRPDAIVCVSTSGRTFKSFEERSEVLWLEGDLKPELASLTLGSLNFPKQASVNEPEMIHSLAGCMSERGIVPELEVFDFGMVDYAKTLLDRGAAANAALLQPPPRLARDVERNAGPPCGARRRPPRRFDVVRRRHRALSVLRQLDGDHDGRECPRRARGQPLARHAQGAARDERRTGRASSPTRAGCRP
jgi:hypothetical protein